MALFPLLSGDVDPLLQRRRLTLVLGVLLFLAFSTASLVSYLAARRSLESTLVDKELPLTSGMVEAELNQTLVRPYLMASMMASNSFLRDWTVAGERDTRQVIRYLRAIRDRHRVVSSFFVSEASRVYYHADGVLKRVSADTPIDRWYFRVRAMSEPYELNVDTDSAGPGRLVAFYNHRVLDDQGRFLGATGVGLSMSGLQALLRQTGERYRKRLYLTDRDGVIRMAGESVLAGRNIRHLEGVRDIAERALATGGSFRYSDGRGVAYLHVRRLPELGLFLFVEGRNDEASAGVRQALYLSLALWAGVVMGSIVLINLTVRRFRHRLEVMATVDHLTGLMSRQAFESACERRLEQARRRGYPVTLVLADLDYFRRINDRFGHLGGDELLRQAAGVLRQGLREGDLLCRWGGEEFLFLFDRCDAGEAERLAEGLRRLLPAHEFSYAGRPQRLTVSMGLATSLPGDTLQLMINRADRALFMAKDSGRNRVQTAG